MQKTRKTENTSYKLKKNFWSLTDSFAYNRQQ